ncbi:MAG TPA: endonuclease/exonuclease/phosphatase family protein [Pseudonocardia sp.]|nr:endonuclease/exonuclease/phosphatase family protein [Pseudonocardia sp.]
MTAPPGQLRPATPNPDPVPPRTRPGRTRRIVRYVAAALFTALGVVVVLPDLLGLDRRVPFAQLVAFRVWVLLAGAIVLALLALALLSRRARPAVAPFLAGGLAVLLVGGAMVLPRVVADPLPTTGAPLTVLTFNAYEGLGDVDRVVALIAEHRPDLISLTEAGQDYAGEIGPLLEPMGYRLEVSSGAARDVYGVTAAVSDRLGDVRFRIGEETSAFPYVEVTGGALGSLRFVAYHAAAPVPGQMADWRDDLALLPQWCAGPTPAIVAGDLNASLDHSLLRTGATGCADAADQRGAGLVPTWSPGIGFRSFGPQIDHVLVTGGIAAETFSAHDVLDSDHRAVVTRLRVPS